MDRWKCPNCSAPLASDGPDAFERCPYCGITFERERPAPEPVRATGSTTTRERLAALAEMPDVRALLASDFVVESDAPGGPTWPVAIVCAVLAVSLVIAALVRAARGATFGLELLVPAVILAFVAASRRRSASDSQRERLQAKVERVPAAVIGKRVSEDATRYLALEFEDGERSEFEVDDDAWYPLTAVGDVGVAYLFEERCVRFRRFEA